MRKHLFPDRLYNIYLGDRRIYFVISLAGFLEIDCRLELLALEMNKACIPDILFA